MKVLICSIYNDGINWEYYHLTTYDEYLKNKYESIKDVEILIYES